MTFFPALFLAGCGSWEFKRVPPGQSLNVALARKGVALNLVTPGTAAKPARSTFNPRNMPKVEEGELPSRTEEGTHHFFAQGNEYLQSGKIKEAVAAFEKAVQIDPGFPDAHYSLGVAYQQNGEEAKSSEEFRKYKSLQGSH